MRKFALLLLVGSAMAVPTAAFSQQGAAPSADDYVCALTGECGDDQAADAVQPTPTPSGRPRVNATRGFSLSRTPNRPVATTLPRQTPPRQTIANRPRQAAARPP